MDKITAFLIAMLLVVIGISSYAIYQNMPGKPQPMLVEFQNSEIIKNLASEVKQFEINMRFNHNNLTYFFSANCDQDRVDKMLKAFSIISVSTPITFSEGSNPDIIINCSEEAIEKEKNVFVAGEGGPKEFINSTVYPVILKGSILLYKESDCKEPIVELHELLHVLGFDHIDDSTSIMYPYATCNQKLNPEYTGYLTKIYSIEPLPDLYFESANVTQSGKYLNFEVIVTNKGLSDAEDVNLDIFSDNKLIDTFPLKKIRFGTGKKFFVENLKLPSKTSSDIKISIDYSGKEYSSENNILSAYAE